MSASPTLYTLGHSNTSLEDLLARLRLAGIETLVDVRRYPGSRKWPHFNRDSLAAALPVHSIAYRHTEALGGRRNARPDSVNTAWKNASFQGYADYMQTPVFQRALEELLETARESPTAIMCSEILWWRCHRSLIADAAVARGWRVVHLLPGRTEEHRLREFARVEGDRVIYPGSNPSLWEGAES
ncbi:MAG: DUF488 domain-containing protein [Armatimonadetes bacterium]|nr:DUF488 domain-containing protein [Armatimonadota bacterium]